MAVLKNIVSKIFNLNTTPAKKTEGQFWYDTSNNVLKRSDGTDYKPLPIDKNTVGNKTLTSVLNNKADKSDLSDYLPKTGGEISSNAHSALTINVTGQGGANVDGGLTVNNTYADWSTPDGNTRTDTTHYGASAITGDAVTNSITSGSEKLITSGGVYAALQNKADKSDLSNYLSSKGGIIQNLTLDETYEQNTITTLNGNYIEIANDFGEHVHTKITATNIEISYPDAPGGASTIMDAQSFSNTSNYGFTTIIGATNIILDELTGFCQINGKTLNEDNDSVGFFGQNIGSLDFETGTINDSIFKVGYTQDYSTDEQIPEISGSLVDKSISSSSLDTHIPTSKAVYTALQNKADKSELANKQDKLSFYSEDTSSYTPSLEIGNGSTYTKIMSIDETDMYVQSIALISETGEIKINTTNKLILDARSISGSAIATTIGTSETSAKLPTEGAVVKAINGVKNSMGSALTYEGSVTNYSNLPSNLTSADKGKVYNVVNANGNIPAGTNYAWNGTSWDALGGDMSAYLRKEGDSLLSLGLFADPQNTGELRISSFNPDSGSNPSDTLLTGDTLTFSVADGPTTIYSAYGFEINRWGRGDAYFKIYPDSGITGSLVDTLIPSTPEEGHIATTDAIKTYVDNSTSNKVEKNSDANLTSIVMPTFSSSTGAQNGSAKLKLYKDDITGAITIEIEEVE